MDLDSLRAVIVTAMPELSRSTFTMLTAGWDSVGVDVDDRLIFKFPRHEAAACALAAEARLLDAIRPVVRMPVPAMTFFAGPPTFTRHAKLPGEHLVTAQYDRLSADARDRLAAMLAEFYAQLHALPAGQMSAAGVRAVQAWLPPEEILRRALPVLPSGLRA